MAFGAKTNERPGTRAQVKYSRVSAYKAREVLDLVRGKHVNDADEILQFVERDVAVVIRKCLASAVANAATNDSQDPETLFISACYADEGPTLKRWRPRARGRASRIRKRTCHITVIVSRMAEPELRIWQAKQAKAAPAGAPARRRGGATADRRARVAKSRQAETPKKDEPTDQVDEVEADEIETTESDAVDESTDTTTTETTDAVEAKNDADESADEGTTDEEGPANASDAAEAPAEASSEAEGDGEALTEERSDEGDS